VNISDEWQPATVLLTSFVSFVDFMHIPLNSFIGHNDVVARRIVSSVPRLSEIHTWCTFSPIFVAVIQSS